MASYNSSQPNQPDLRYIDYFSDGKILNTTLWLNNIFESKPPNNSDFHYGILIDADSNSKTGLQGVDYQVDVLFDNIKNKWIKNLNQYSTSGFSRSLSTKAFTISSSQSSNKSISISLDLNSISNPGNFRAMFYTYMYNSSSLHYIVDFSSWIDIPPLTYTISTTNDPIQLRPNDNENVGADVKSNLGSIPEIISIHTVNNSLPIKANVVSDIHNSKINGNKPVTINLYVDRNAPVGQYSIPLFANISTGLTFLPKIFYINIPSLPKSIPTQGYTITPLNLTAQVLKPLTLSEGFKEFWGTYGNFISLLSGGFIAGAASIVLDRLKKNRDSRHMQNHKQNH